MAASKNTQSGKITSPSAAPFATPNGRPTNTGGQPRNLELVSSAPPIDSGDGGAWDVDQSEVPVGGRVLKADPPTNTSGGGGLGNGGNAAPFKNLR
jgi:hypothetical protein